MPLASGKFRKHIGLGLSVLLSKFLSVWTLFKPALIGGNLISSFHWPDFQSSILNLLHAVDGELAKYLGWNEVHKI